MNKQKGIASMVVMVAMLVMAVALPIATKLVQQNQENRSKATSNVSYSGTCQTSCVNNACSGSSLQLGGNYSSTTEADCLCGASNCSKYYINRSGALVGCEQTTSSHISSSACTRVAGTTCYSSYSACRAATSTTTYTCSARACSANYGCMRNGVFTSSDAACTTPIGTVSRTYDASCPRISDAVLATLGSSGNNDACQITTSCTSGEKQCSGNILQKCNSDGTAWETDTDCGDLGCDAATKACKVVSSTCDDIPTTCSGKDFAAYKANGDFNCNETVDIIDFSLWKGWFNADKEQCGSITDFNIWKDAFNKSN